MVKLIIVKDLRTSWELLGAYDGKYDHLYLASEISILKKITTTIHELGHKIITQISSRKNPTKLDGLLDFCTSWLDMPENTGKAIAKVGLRKYYYMRVNRYSRNFISVYDADGNLYDIIKGE